MVGSVMKSEFHMEKCWNIFLNFRKGILIDFRVINNRNSKTDYITRNIRDLFNRLGNFF